jgi:hypothetical protein
MPKVIPKRSIMVVSVVALVTGGLALWHLYSFARVVFVSTAGDQAPAVITAKGSEEAKNRHVMARPLLPGAVAAEVPVGHDGLQRLAVGDTVTAEIHPALSGTVLLPGFDIHRRRGLGFGLLYACVPLFWGWVFMRYRRLHRLREQQVEGLREVAARIDTLPPDLREQIRQPQ